MLPTSRRFESTKVSKYVKINSVAEGEVVAEGTYVRAEDSVKFPGRIARHLRTDSGEIVAVSGCSSLNNAFETVEIGDYVRVIYTGTHISKGAHAGSSFISCDVQRCVEESPAPAPVNEATAPSLD
jgi:hypothetical protein